MKRLSLCVSVMCAACLLLAPAALASTKSHSPARVRHAAATPRSFGQLGDDPMYAISGHVLDVNGDPVQGAEVDWGWFDGIGFNWGGTYNLQSSPPWGTGASGEFAFPSVSGHPGNDYLDVVYPEPTDQQTDWLAEMKSWSLDFSADNDATPPSGYSYDMQPGKVQVTIANAPSALPEVKVGDADTPGYAITELALNGGGVAGVLPPQFNDVVVSYPSRRGVLAEVEAFEASPVSVTPGAIAADPVAVDWDNAQYAYLAGPLCRHSGKPGSTVKMALKGWPAGEKAIFSDSNGDFYKTTQLSAGPTFSYLVPLKIATGVAVGPYWIDTYNSDPASFVDLSDTYQVCTFKPSASSIRPGHAVRLSGRVYGKGNVTIYSTTHKASAQPSTLAAKGWHRVGAYKTSSGKFITGLLRPSRTTWYVAKYTGWAFPAFTSVVRVTVR